MIFDKINPKPLGNEKILLKKAHNRLLAEDIITKLDIPPFDRSTVDGFAIKAEDSYGADENNPIKLNLIGEISVGLYPNIQLKNGEAVEIVTGAPIPIGANSVIMVENTQKQKKDLHREVFCQNKRRPATGNSM